ncbi:MAG: PEFG-CTERM sorting domain-containing protein [Nitrosopumilaceae archaeon]
MQFILSKNIPLLVTFTLFSFLVSFVSYEAYGDGLTMEILPPASLGDRQASLFIQVNPPILTSDTTQDTFVKLRLFDANNNQTIQSNSFFVEVKKDDKLLMRELFYTKSGFLTIKFKPTDTPGKWQAYGDIEPTLGGWTATNDEVRVDAPVFLEGGLYHFEIKFIGVDAAKNIFAQGNEPTFNSYLSVGDVFKTPIKYQTKSYDTEIISYYDRIKDFKFDESKNLILFSMPFDWDVSRFENQNIFVHEEIQIPKSFKEFTDTNTFTAKVNGFPLVGRMLAVDPYSKEDTLILHYLINKNDILGMAKNISPDTKSMDFTLTPGFADAQTSTEILTDFGGFRAELEWSPANLKANTKTNLKVTFYDAFSGIQVAGDVKYDLKILDKNGNAAFSKTDLDAIGGVDTQSITFVNDDVYTIEIDIKSITINEKTDSSRLGIARGVVVVPEFGSIAILVLIIAIGIIIATRIAPIKSRTI